MSVVMAPTSSHPPPRKPDCELPFRTLPNSLQDVYLIKNLACGLIPPIRMKSDGLAMFYTPKKLPTVPAKHIER